MKKILIVTLTFVLNLLFFTTPTIYAEENSIFPFKSLSKAIIKDENGEIISEMNLDIDCEIKSLNITSYSTSILGAGIEYVAKAEASYEVLSNNDFVQPLGIVGDVSGTGVIGYLYMKFSWYPTTEKIQVTQIYGSWEVPDTYYLESRKVDAWTDTYQSPFPKYPSSNSFSYLIGWDKEYWNPPSYISGAKANSSAIVTVPGMTGGEKELFLYCEVTYDDLQ